MSTWKNIVSPFLRRFPSRRWIVLLICVGTIGVHGGAVANDFCFDDRSQILQGRLIQSWKNVPAILTSEVWRNVERENRLEFASVDTFRPLFNMSLLVDHHLAGSEPLLYHAENLAIHLINILLLFLIADALVGGASALFATALFALFPTTVTCIHYVSARPDSAMTLFCLLTVLLAVGGEARRPGRLIAMGMCLLAALLWKETAVIVPVVAPLLYLMSSPRASWKTAGLQASVLLAALGVYFALRLHALGSAKAVVDGAHLITMVVNYPRAVLSLAQAAVLLQVPLPLRSFDVVFPPWSAPFVVAVCLFYLGAGAAIVRGVVLRRPETGALYWALFAIAPPVTAMVRTDIIDGHYFYPSTAGLALQGGFALRALYDRGLRPRLLRALQGVILVSAALLSFIAGQHFRTEVTFYRAIIDVGPHAAIAEYNLANAYMRRSMWGEAAVQYLRVLAVQPDDAKAHNNLSVVLLGMNRVDEAVDHARAAVALERRNPRHHYNLALALLRDGRAPEALQPMETALTLDPAYPAALETARRMCVAPRQPALEGWCERMKRTLRRGPT